MRKKSIFQLDRFLLAAAVLLSVAFAPAGAASAEGAPTGPLAPNPNVNAKPLVDSKYYQLIIDIEAQILTVLRKDESGEYTVIDRQVRCSTARTGKITPTGNSFKITTKSRWLSSPAYNSYEQFACRINGKIWIHSTCFWKRDPNMLDAESYQDLGKPVSAGCIRLSVRDAFWVYANCPGNTVVKVVKNGGPAPVCLEELPPLPEGATYDPTDPAVVR
jgi:lipoprotein-anchoring transpeptidase ErfK/SrfK